MVNLLVYFVNLLDYLIDGAMFGFVETTCARGSCSPLPFRRYTVGKMSQRQVTPDQIQELRQEHTGRLLLRAYRHFSDMAASKLHARGHGVLGAAAMALIPHIDLEGTRITVLAERAGITKQAAGQLVNELEAAGYVQRQPDEADGRAFMVVFTKKGWRLLRDSYEIKLEIEAGFEVTLGQRRMQMLKNALRDLLETESG